MEPMAELDKRFSDAGAQATAWGDVRRELQAAELFWVTTVRADGRPHVTPLVAVWLDEALYLCTGASEQKAVNLRTNQNVILATGSNRWDEGLDIVVEGKARRISDDGRLRRLAETWRTKWDGRWHFEARDGAFHHEGGDGEALVFEVAPTKVLSFSKGDLAATRYRFGSA